MELHRTYPLGTDPLAAARMLVDPAFLAARVQAAGGVAEHIDVTGSAEGAFTVTTRRRVPTTEIPGPLAALVGDHLDVRQVEAWEAPEPDGRRVGTVVVEVAGAPIRLTGRCRLDAAPGDGSVLVYEGELRATVPFFAAAIEDAAAGAVTAVLDAEADTARDWLAGPHS